MPKRTAPRSSAIQSDTAAKVTLSSEANTSAQAARCFRDLVEISADRNQCPDLSRLVHQYRQSISDSRRGPPGALGNAELSRSNCAKIGKFRSFWGFC